MEMNSESSCNHGTSKDREHKQETVAAKGTITESGSCFNDQPHDPQSKDVTILISGDLTSDPLYQMLCTPFAKKSEKTKVLKSFMKTDMNMHFAQHCDHVAAQAVLNNLTEAIKEKHGYWGAEDCAAALLKLFYLLKQPGNQGKTRTKEAQRIIDMVEKCEEELANPSKPAPPAPGTNQSARNHLPTAPITIRHFSEWEEDWTADPAYLALQSPFIRKSERVAVIKSFVNKHPSESFKQSLHCRARDLFEEVNQEVKRDRYHWNVHMCASSIIRLHKLLVQDKVYKPDRGGNKPETVLPTHVQKLMKMYQKCVVKSKEIREKKLDGALKPGCTLEDFDKEVEDKFVESFKKKSIVSLREMVDRRKREVQVIEDCTALLAGLQERPGEEGVEDADRGGGGRTRQKGERVRPTSTTSTDSHFSKNRRKKRLPSGKSRGAAKLPKSSTASPRRAGKRLKRSFDEEEEQQEGNHQPPVMPSSARGMLHRAPPPAPPPPPSVPLVHHQHDRVPSVLYDPALAPSSWTPQPQQYFYHPAPPVSSRGPPPPPAPAPARDTYPSYHVDQGGAHDHPSPASSSYAAAYRSYDDNEGSTGRANPPSRAFHNAYTAPAPPSSQTFYRSYAPIMPSFQQKSVASRVLDYALLELAGARADVVRYEQLRLAVATLTSGDPVVNQVLDDLYRNGVVSLEQLVQFTLSFGTREGNIVPRTARATF